MSAVGDRIRALLDEGQQIALERFGAEKVRDVPLLVTHIALTMTQIDVAPTPTADTERS